MGKISEWLIPPGGWYFQEGAFKIEGQTFSDLVVNLRTHRKSNGKPEGDPVREIHDQISSRWPEGTIDKVNGTHVSTPIQRAQNFFLTLKNFILEGGAFVDQNTANIRSQICATCHNNVPGSEARPVSGSCRGCGKLMQSIEESAIAASRRFVVGDRRTDHDELLKSCGICGCDNRVAIWFPLNAFRIDETNRNAYPTFCWKKGG